MKVGIAILCCSLFFRFCSAANKEVTMNGVTVKVLGQSGKVMIGKSGEDIVTMEMDKLAEYTVDGMTEVGKSGKERHSFNTFASLDFEFTKEKSAKYQGIDATAFNFTSQISDAMLTVTVAIFEANGTAVNDNEEISIVKGMVKIDITISNWSFCNPCKEGKKEEFGDNLQFTITIKGKNGAPAAEKQLERLAATTSPMKPEKYFVGDDVGLIISKKYKDNDVWKDMASGYPKLVTVGSKKSFVFRFEKFNGTVFYDPIVDVTESPGTSTSATTTTTAPTPSSGGGMAHSCTYPVILLLFITQILSLF